WQHHHIRAEAERQVRGRLTPDQWADVVAAITETALSEPISIPRGVHDLTPAADGLSRSDGTSVYTTARSTLHTSPQILAAEARLVDIGLRHDGHRIARTAVDTALVEYAANNDGLTLNSGQVAMVRAFATSGARLQVGLAPAGTGKTTSMRVLADAWTEQGGTVIGLAPTAAAAAKLAEETEVECSTVDLLVSLAQRLETGELTDPPEWLSEIGPRTLVILDEAAKTATLTLDSALTWLIDRGASVRAIGDDRQLSSVAAGGVIRDIVAYTGSADLTTVMRFTDLGERAASLAVREGDPAGLAYYLDHDRIRTGSLDAVIEQAYLAWVADIDAGLDSALLAPTRELVTDLNARARVDRLARTDTEPGAEAVLADGLSASAGDIICTRLNNRRLRISKTDYVRNGYRWQVQTVHDDGRITATHTGSRRRVTLPADYVANHTQLGYATTIDASQGITVDTCHGVLTGRETCPQLYVMLTRGRTSNRAWLATNTGDEPNLYEYESVRPQTALDVLTTILGREGTQTSAATADAEARDPRRQLAAAVDSYLDALGVAAETRYGPDQLAALDAAAEQLLPGLTGAAAYPVLRQHLAAIALHGRLDPIQTLAEAINLRELDTAADPAAVLDWRIDPTGLHSTARPSEMGPLGWLPSTPAVLLADDEFGPHLRARATQIRQLADQVRTQARAWTEAPADQVPLWAQPLRAHPDLLAPLALWRASHAVPDHDRRPTGPVVPGRAEREIQSWFDEDLARRLGDTDADLRRWAGLASRLEVPGLTEDPVWPVLATELTRAAEAGRDIGEAAITAAADRPLPAEQPAAALRWRLAGDLDELPPAIADPVTDLVHVMEHDRLRRISDNALDDKIRQLNNQLRARQHDAVAIIGGAAENKTAMVTAEHERLDHQAAQIRDAQSQLAELAERRALAAAEHTERTSDLREILTRKKSWLGSKAHNKEVADKRREVAESAEILRRYTEQTRQIERDAATASGVPTMQWQQTLDAAADLDARQAELDAARQADERRAEQLRKYDAGGERLRTDIHAAVTERRRRNELTDLDREREQQARDHLDGTDSLVRATGVLDHHEHRTEPPIERRRVHEQPRDLGPDIGL
ncbi:AAA family ATPase, partial [Nocardia neocaledoniensis]|uniref:AAA family ATPase n=1 Tax=Nocardia neocaledoniensis TaxID=236511 RepID=UPI0024539791